MKIVHVLIALGIFAVLSGCTEPYALQTRNFESALVIEASVTNELKNHAFKISRAYRFEDAQTFENGATVYVENETGNIIQFSQQDSMYVSDFAFLPDPQLNYRLHVTTADGKTYSSTPQKQTSVNPIENLNPIVTNLGTQQGVSICVNSYDPSGSSRYYRYEFEDAGRFRTPLYSENEIIIAPDGSDGDLYPDIILQPRTEEAQICYRKGRSKNIVLASTTELSEDRIVNFPIRFIPDTSYIINDRYAIKVRQFVQNLESYTFYETLRDISSTGNILSQTQPGFFYGNITSESDQSEKVFGFFEVSTVSEAILRFDYNEIFPDSLPIPWPYECTQSNLNPTDWTISPKGDAWDIVDLVNNNQMYFTYWGQGDFYILASDQCVDCRGTGSNITPPFWQD